MFAIDFNRAGELPKLAIHVRDILMDLERNRRDHFTRTPCGQLCGDRAGSKWTLGGLPRRSRHCFPPANSRPYRLEHAQTCPLDRPLRRGLCRLVHHV